MRKLTRKNLKGLWSAVPTPFDNENKIDFGILAENCSRLAAVGVDGIYTTDADGEFYAIEIDEFATLAKAFSRAIESTSVDAAMGISWFNTRGVFERLRIAIDNGIPNVHVALPLFMPLSNSDVDRFFDDLATQVPEGRWIHYAHSRSQPALTGKDYARLAKLFSDQLIGSKIAAVSDISELTEILTNASALSHQAGDPTLAISMFLGARGNCSYWVNTLPKWCRSYMDACLASQWSKAMAYHKKLCQWEREYILPLRKAGYRHGILGRARAALSGFLVEGASTRAPYYPIEVNLRTQLQVAFDKFWENEIRQESFVTTSQKRLEC